MAETMIIMNNDYFHRPRLYCKIPDSRVRNTPLVQDEEIMVEESVLFYFFRPHIHYANFLRK